MTPGQAAYEARHVAKGRRMGADDAAPDGEILAVIALSWDELPAGMQADEEAGAQAAIDAAGPVPSLILKKFDGELTEEEVAEIRAALDRAVKGLKP